MAKKYFAGQDSSSLLVDKLSSEESLSYNEIRDEKTKYERLNKIILVAVDMHHDCETVS